MMDDPIRDDPFGLLHSSVFDDPHGTYHILRATEPVYWHPLLQAWILTRYKDVLALLEDHGLLSSERRRPVATARLSEQQRQAMEPIDDYLRHWLLNTDPPVHTTLRDTLEPWFHSREIAAIESSACALAIDLFDRFKQRGGGDLIAQFAHPFPVTVIADMVGVPSEDRDRLLQWFAVLSSYFERGAGDSSILSETGVTIAEIDDWLTTLLNERRRQPRNDLISRLAHSNAVIDGGPRAVRSTLLLLLFSGHESTRSTIGSGLLTLLSNPAAMQQLRANAKLIPRAVEEFLRLDGPFMRQDRVITRDYDIEGKRLAAGQRVILVLGAANRDPQRFYAPDQLILDRRNNRHLAFGHGTHYCLGAHLARLELRIAFEIILTRSRHITFSGRGARWRPHFNNRSLSWLDIAAD
jgi:cytochrome P450